MLGSSQDCGVESKTHIVSQKKKKKKGKHPTNISQGDLNPRDSIIDESSQEIIDTQRVDEERSGRKSELNDNMHRLSEELQMKDNLIQ